MQSFGGYEPYKAKLCILLQHDSLVCDFRIEFQTNIEGL